MARTRSSRAVHVVLGSVACIAAVAACNALLGNDERNIDEGAESGGSSGNANPPRSDGAGTLDGAVTGDGAGDDTGSPADGGADADADAGPVFVGCLGDAGCERVMFVTKQTFQGNLGGVAGADAKCQAAADQSPLLRIKGHAFRAWVSTSAQAARDRHVHGTQKYLRANGTTTLADHFDDLVQNGPNGAIHDQDDTLSDKGAWTGTKNDGDKAAATCADWTATVGSTGLTGNPDQPATWSEDPPAVGCENTATLICVER